MMPEWNSQLGQDRFVSLALEGKRDGTFCDIGAGQPAFISNTLVLQREYGWHGILCDIEFAQALQAERGLGNIVRADAFKVDWALEMSHYAKDGWLDYLSLDIEPPNSTVNLLLRLPLDRFKFRVATVEHDEYRDDQGEQRRDVMRAIMTWYGYETICSVSVLGGQKLIEDWWIHRDARLNRSRILDGLKEFNSTIMVSGVSA